MPITYDDLTEAVRFLDGEMEDNPDGGIDLVFEKFEIDEKACFDVSVARAAMVRERLPHVITPTATAGIELLSGLGAAWMDGLCTALRIVERQRSLT